MGIFDQLERPTPQAVTWHPADDRWYKPLEQWAETFAGFPISPDTAMRVSAVFACTSLLAEVIASLPCVLYRRLDNGGKEKARDHRLYRTLRQRPNRRHSRIDYFGTQQMHLGLRGNALAEIRDDGATVELLPLHPDYVTVELTDAGRYRYEIRDGKGGEPRTLAQERVLHVRDLSMDGLVGQSRSALAREAIAVAAAAEGYVGKFFKYDATGRLVITHPTALDETKRAEWRKTMAENQEGWQNRSRTMFLHSGVTATEIGKHDDSGFIIDPRRFQVADIARFWRVPLFMIGLEEKSTTWGSGLEQQKQGFVDFTIKSWADRHTEAMTLALLDEDEQEEFFIEFLFADLVRGDLLTRLQAYQIGITNGIWNPNEIRIKENEGPRAGGDAYRETPPGTAPNAAGSADRRAPAPPPGDEEEPEAQRVPAPLVADAVHRIASREIADVGARLSRANTDPAKWAAWLLRYYAEHGEYVRKVLGPLLEAFQLEGWIADEVAERLTRTADGLTAEAAPAWLARRRQDVATIVDETFIAGAAARRRVA